MNTVAVDTHVHLYHGADPGMAFAAGRANLVAAARTVGGTPETLALVVTDTSRHDAFDALAEERIAVRDWRIEALSHDAAALRAIHANGDALVVVAGRQIVSEEGLEILALATRQRFTDGRPIRAVLKDLRSRDIPAVLPWGLGKWIGARGRHMASLLAETEVGGLILGDNAGRPRGWLTPPLFRSAAAKAIPVLPGSDPLPIPGSEAGIGRYGCILQGQLDPDRPADDLRLRLLHLKGQPATIGTRKGVRAVVADQIALRRRKAGRPSAGLPETTE